MAVNISTPRTQVKLAPLPQDTPEDMDTNLKESPSVLFQHHTVHLYPTWCQSTDTGTALTISTLRTQVKLAPLPQDTPEGMDTNLKELRSVLR